MLRVRAAGIATMIGLIALCALVTPALGQLAAWDAQLAGDEDFRILQVADLPDLTVVDEHIKRATAELFGGDPPPLTFWRAN